MSQESFSTDERAAMKERAREAKRQATAAEDLDDVLAKIAEMPDSDRSLAEHVHATVLAAAPELACKTWYGMPAYAKDGTIVCFFQAAQKFKSRYATLGFSDAAALDDGTLWPTTFA
ncbi:MAG: iron chaperone, partial [Rhodoglobus sp.]